MQGCKVALSVSSGSFPLPVKEEACALFAGDKLTLGRGGSVEERAPLLLARAHDGTSDETPTDSGAVETPVRLSQDSQRQRRQRCHNRK